MPPPKCFVYANPVQVNYDDVTLLWLHSFGRSLEKSLAAAATPPAPTPTPTPGAAAAAGLFPRPDVRFEAVLPRVSSFTEFLLGFNGFYWVWLGFIGF